MLTTRKFAPAANPASRFLSSVGGQAQHRLGGDGLAARTAELPETVPASQTATEPLPTAHLSTLHLLVVDDDDALRRACCEIARGMGFTVHNADSVPAARTVLQQQPIDLLLLDMKLPGGGGLALLGEVKTLYPEIAVLVMTAYATVSSAVEAMKIGASDYLTKPFAIEELTAMLGPHHRQLPGDGEALPHPLQGRPLHPSPPDPGRERHR
jgi:CheY-like chemotaxis protein